MDIYSKVVFMIKQTWNIPSDEKLRILKLHESATKKLYLGEQFVGGSEPVSSTTTQELLKQEQLPDGTYFSYPLNKITKKPGSVDGYVQNGKIYIIWDGEWRELPNINEIGKPKFLPNEETENYLDAVEEWEWTNSLNDQNPGWGTPQDPFFYIPSYDKYNHILHLLRYELVTIKKPKGREQTTEFLQANDNKYIVNSRGLFCIVEGDSDIKAGQAQIKKEIPPKEIPPKEEPKVLELNLEEPFKFDRTVLSDSAQKAFKEFIEQVKNQYKGVGGNIDVITSASIDAPNREDYNMDLSKRRASAIIEILKKEWADLGFTYTPKPIGETDKFAPGKTYKNKFSTKETAPNRRLVIKLPQIKKTVE